MRNALLRLSLARGIGPHLIKTLLSFSSEHTKWSDCPMLTIRQKKLVRDALADDAAFEAQLGWCQQNNARVITVLDDEYPPLLRQIAVPPAVLWAQGGPVPTGPVCALVGARDITNYAQRAIKVLVPALVAAGVATISGGARGVDGVVHTQTVDRGGHTVVVMGAGLQHCYPPEHHTLFKQVVASGGTLLSPFAPHIAPSTGTFPARNRIIAGLSPLCVVVQAAKKSGALITASYALEQNREVAAVPGPIDELRHCGSNALLAQGALVVTDAQMLVGLCAGTSVASTVADDAYAGLSSLACLVLDNLDVPALFDTLLALIPGSEPVGLQAALFELQVAGKVTQDFAGMWERHE